MKKLIAVLFLAFAIQSHGATMFGTFTNYLGQPDTNSFLIYRLGGATARADGTWVTAGLPTRITPQTNGYWETSLQVGNYMATNASLAPGIVFRVPDDQGGNSYSIWSNRLSGYNTFVTLVYGDNPPPTFGQITNALNGKPVFQEELDAAIVSATNGFTSIVRSNASVFLHTNALPALTNGFVRSDITNLSATISLLNTSSNSLRTVLTSTINTASNANHVLILAATNGLARTTITNGLVSQAEINTSSNSLRTSLTSTINTASNQNHTLIVAATNGLARTTITNGLVSQTEINTSSNALRTSLIGTINTTSNALWQEIGTGSGGAGTNYVDAQVAAATNSLRTSLITVINSSSNANRSFTIDATNGLARLTDTNGFVRQANIDASSNSLRSGLVTTINTASNTARSFSIDTTNGLRQALSSAMTVTNLSFSGNPFMRRDTNIVAVYGAGNTTNNGTYVWESGLYRKTVGPGSIYFVNPTWFMEDGSATIYSAQNPIGPWTVISGSGPAPISDYGYYVDLNGAVFLGTFVSTNLSFAVTNGFQSATNYARSATNVLNSNLTTLINTASNANHSLAIAVTNGLAIDVTTAVNTASNAIRTDLAKQVTTTNVTIGSDLVLEQNTNVLSITGAGTATANGTYVWNSTGKVFTNTHTGSYVTNNSGDYVIRSVENASLYSSSTLIANNYTLGSGDSPSPTVVYGQRLDLSGMEFYGAIHSTNLNARLAEGVANAAALGNIPASAYVTNGGVANVTSTNATHLSTSPANAFLSPIQARKTFKQATELKVPWLNSLKQVKTLATGENLIHGFRYYSGSGTNFIFASTATTPAKLLRFNPDNLDDYTALTMPSGVNLNGAYQLVEARGYIFMLATSGSTVSIVRVDPLTMETNIIVAGMSIGGSATALAADDNYLYAARDSVQGVVYQWSLDDYSLVATNALNQTVITWTNGSYPHALMSDGTNVYVTGGGTQGAWVGRIATNLTFTLQYLTNNGATGDDAFKYPTDDFAELGDYLYIGNENPNGLFAEVRKSDLSYTLLDSGVRGYACWGVHAINGYIWLTYASDPGTVVRFDPQTREAVTFTLGSGESPNELVSDGQRLFMSTYTTPSKVMRYSLLPGEASEVRILGNNKTVRSKLDANGNLTVAGVLSADYAPTVRVDGVRYDNLDAAAAAAELTDGVIELSAGAFHFTNQIRARVMVGKGPALTRIVSWYTNVDLGVAPGIVLTNQSHFSGFQYDFGYETVQQDGFGVVFQGAASDCRITDVAMTNCPYIGLFTYSTAVATITMENCEWQGRYFNLLPGASADIHIRNCRFIEFGPGVVAGAEATGGNLQTSTSKVRAFASLFQCGNTNAVNIHYTGAGFGNFVGCVLTNASGATQITNLLAANATSQIWLDGTRFQPGGIRKAAFANVRITPDLFQSALITTAATATTTNVSAGRVRISSGNTTYYVTNNMVTTSSAVLATLNSADATASNVVAIPSAGLIMLQLNASPTSNADVTWMILNPFQ